MKGKVDENTFWRVPGPFSRQRGLPAFPMEVIRTSLGCHLLHVTWNHELGGFQVFCWPINTLEQLVMAITLVYIIRAFVKISAVIVKDEIFMCRWKPAQLLRWDAISSLHLHVRNFHLINRQSLKRRSTFDICKSLQAFPQYFFKKL